MNEKSNDRRLAGRREFLHSAAGIVCLSLLESAVLAMRDSPVQSGDGSYSASMMAAAAENATMAGQTSRSQMRLHRAARQALRSHIRIRV